MAEGVAQADQPRADGGRCREHEPSARLVRLLRKLWRYTSPEEAEKDERDWIATAMRSCLQAEPNLVEGRMLTVKARLLGPMKWMNHYASQCRWRHNALRLIAVLAGSVTPALAGLDLRVAAVVAGVVAAASLGIDEFLGFGDRWRHHRAVSEALKREAWLFVESRQSGEGAPLARAFGAFAGRVEAILQGHWGTYGRLADDRTRTRGENGLPGPSRDVE